jgi:hypothetical protein
MPPQFLAAAEKAGRTLVVKYLDSAGVVAE